MAYHTNYHIIPLETVYENYEAKNREDALCDFATSMDSDMNRYFKAVPAAEISHTLAKRVTDIIRSNTFTASECSDIFRVLLEQGSVLGGKFWTDEDIANTLNDIDVDDNPENVAAVKTHVQTWVLEETTDKEWNAINEAITIAHQKGEISRAV